MSRRATDKTQSLAVPIRSSEKDSWRSRSPHPYRRFIDVGFQQLIPTEPIYTGTKCSCSDKPAKQAVFPSEWQSEHVNSSESNPTKFPVRLQCGKEAMELACAILDNACVRADIEGIQRETMAVVFDIDDTVLLTKTFTGQSKNICNPIVKTVYNKAIESGLSVFFVTARTDNGLRETRRELQTLGYNHSSIRGIFARPTEGLDGNPVSVFKHLCRETILHEGGYFIVLNIGDQWSDLFLSSCAFEDDVCASEFVFLKGNHGEIAFRLPNPYAVLP